MRPLKETILTWHGRLAHAPAAIAACAWPRRPCHGGSRAARRCRRGCGLSRWLRGGLRHWLCGWQRCRQRWRGALAFDGDEVTVVVRRRSDVVAHVTVDVEREV